MTRIRRWWAARQCRRHGHVEMCHSDVFLNAEKTERHWHDCLRCGVVTKNEITPWANDTKRVLADLGLIHEDQRTYMH